MNQQQNHKTFTQSIVVILSVSFIVLSCFLLTQNDSEYSIFKSVDEIQAQLCENQLDSNGNLISATSPEGQAKSIKSQQMLKSMRPESALKKYSKDSDSTAFVTAIGMNAAPPGFFLVLSLLMFIGYIIIFCCPCCICKCCKKEGEYSTCEKAWPPIAVVVFGLVAVGISIAGIVYAPDISTGYQAFKCAFANSMKDFNSGTKTPKVWVGFANMGTKLNGLNSQMTTFQNVITSTFGTQPWMATSKTDLQTKSTALKLLTPAASFKYGMDPNTGTITAGSEVTSIYFANVWPGKVQTVIDVINIQLTAVVTSMTDLQTVGENLKLGIDAFKSAISAGTGATTDLTNVISDFTNTFYTFTTSGDGVILNIVRAFQGFFLVVLILSILCIIAIIIILVFKAFRFRAILHFAWFFFSILMILGFLFSAIMMPLTITLNEGCEIINGVLTDVKQLDAYPNMIPPSMTGKLKRCISALGGDGDITTELGIRPQLNELSYLSGNVTTALASTSSSDANFQSMQTLDATLIPNLITDLNSLITNVGVSGTADILSLQTAVDNVNKLSDSNDNGAVISTQALLANCNAAVKKDQWVSVMTACKTSPTVTTSYHQTRGTALSVYATIPDETCFLASTFTAAEVNNRYVAAEWAGCANAAAHTLSIYNKLTNIFTWNDQRKAMANLKLTETNALKTANVNFQAQITTWRANIASFKTATDNFVNPIVDPASGLLSNVDCLFLGKNVNNIYDSICTTTLPALAQLMILIFTISFCLFILSFVYFCSAYRFLRIQEMEQKIQADQDQAKTPEQQALQEM